MLLPYEYAEIMTQAFWRVYTRQSLIHWEDMTGIALKNTEDMFTRWQEFLVSYTLLTNPDAHYELLKHFTSQSEVGFEEIMSRVFNSAELWRRKANYAIEEIDVFPVVSRKSPNLEEVNELARDVENRINELGYGKENGRKNKVVVRVTNIPIALGPLAPWLKVPSLTFVVHVFLVPDQDDQVNLECKPHLEDEFFH